MKKLFKSVLFVILGVIILYYFNSLYINTNYYKSQDFTQRFINVKRDLEVVNLGSSHGMYGFYYDDYNIQAANFGLYAQGFYYDYRILKQYSDHIKEGATVFIPISYFSFYQAYEGEKFEKFNKSYYRFLKPIYIKNLKLKEYITLGLFPILSEGGNIKNVFYDIGYEKKDWETITHNKFNKDGSIQKEGYERAIHHQKTIINPGKKYIPQTTKELENIIEFCLEKNYKPVLVTTPYLKYYNDFFSPRFYNEFYGIIDKILAKYKGVTYIDYSHDKRFINDINSFVDSDHMNLKGRKKFTKIILEDIKLTKQKEK